MGYRLNIKREYTDSICTLDGLSYNYLPIEDLLNEENNECRNDFKSMCMSRSSYNGCNWCECWDSDWYKITWESLWKYCDVDSMRHNQNLVSSFCPHHDTCNRKDYCCDCESLKENHFDYVWANIS